MLSCVKYDGVVGRYQHTPYLVDLVNTGSVIIPDLKINISERFFDPGKRDLLYIPYSGVAKLYVFGKQTWSMSNSIFLSICLHCFDTVGLGGRKGIRPVKNEVVGCWCGYPPGVR